MSDKQEMGWEALGTGASEAVGKGCSLPLQREPSLPASSELVGAMGVETRQEWGQVVRTAWQGRGVSVSRVNFGQRHSFETRLSAVMP